MALFVIALCCGGISADSETPADGIPELRSPGTEVGGSPSSQDAKLVLEWRLPDDLWPSDPDAIGATDPYSAVTEGPRFELEQADNPDFAPAVTRYQGSDRTSVLTGLAEGDYFFRVRVAPEDGEPGPWSETLAAEVEFFSRGRVFLLVGLGFAVVAATVVAILYGHFRSPDPS